MRLTRVKLERGVANVSVTTLGALARTSRVPLEGRIPEPVSLIEERSRPRSVSEGSNPSGARSTRMSRDRGDGLEEFRSEPRPAAVSLLALGTLALADERAAGGVTGGKSRRFPRT